MMKVHHSFVFICLFQWRLIMTTRTLQRHTKIHHKPAFTSAVPNNARKNTGLQQQSYKERISDTNWTRFQKMRVSVNTDAISGERRLVTDCNLIVSKRSAGHFRYKIVHDQLNFVFTHLNFSPQINVTFDRFVVDGLVWTWTYFGDLGGFRLLSHPAEAILWSLGLLHKSVGGMIDPMELMIETNGCQIAIEIGEESSTYKIGNALKDILYPLYNVKEDFRANFWCYWKRKYIEIHWIYILCLHVVCPIPHVEYRCCARHFVPANSTWNLDCSSRNTFVNDFVWYIPFISGCIFFLNMPLFLFWFAWKISSETESLISSSGYLCIQDESEDGLQIECEQVIFLTEKNAVTLFRTMFNPCLKVTKLHTVLVSRMKRILFISLTLFCIAAQFILDSIWTMDNFVSSCVYTGVPMGFRSLRAGYLESKVNFLPYLGGPIVALSLYIVISVLFIVCPEQLPAIFENGLSKNVHIQNHGCWSPLLLRDDIIQQLGSVPLPTQTSYRKFFYFFKMNMFCILNSRFWSVSFRIQKARFSKLHYCYLKIVFFLPYAIFCFFETIMSVLLYGLPLFMFVKLILKAYVNRVFSSVGEHGRNNALCFLFRSVSLIIIICACLCQTFMLCTIFLDAFVFISRVFVYTYEGIVLYPKTAYGCIIFAVTVLYYIVRTNNEFSKFYQNLLRRLIKLSLKQKAVDINESFIVKRHGEYRGVPIDLFDAVVEKIKPRRIKVFTSLVKILMIFFIAAVTTKLMLHMNEFNHIDVLVHVGTTLFICALPKLVEQFSIKFNKRASKQLDNEILSALKEFAYSGLADSVDENNDRQGLRNVINDLSISVE